MMFDASKNNLDNFSGEFIFIPDAQLLKCQRYYILSSYCYVESSFLCCSCLYETEEKMTACH